MHHIPIDLELNSSQEQTYLFVPPQKHDMNIIVYIYPVP